MPHGLDKRHTTIAAMMARDDSRQVVSPQKHDMESGQKDRLPGREGNAECSGSQSQIWLLEPCDISELTASFPHAVGLVGAHSKTRRCSANTLRSAGCKNTCTGREAHCKVFMIYRTHEDKAGLSSGQRDQQAKDKV